MDHQDTYVSGLSHQSRLLATLEGLLAIQTVDVKSALTQASQVVAEVLQADKVDIFLFEPAKTSLVAVGTSDTPMGRHQIRAGLDRLPLANGGKTAAVFQTGDPYHSGRVDQDLDELRGIREELGVRSAMVVPLDVNGMRRGAVQVDSAQRDKFSPDDLMFLKAIAHWIGLLYHRAELAEHVAQEAAEHARRVAADELIAVLAHDLRGPLTPVRGYLNMIVTEAERAGHATYTTYARNALRGTDRLLRMIDNLLDATRLERGLFSEVPEVVELTVLAQETAALLRTPQHPIEAPGEQRIVIEGDSNRIRQLLENLVTNAQRHSPDGVPVVIEGGYDQDDDGTWAVLTVQDKGPGIPPDLLPHIFTRFARGKSTSGLGLGLYIAYGIAETHKGRLTVESKLGRGTTFRLALPVPPGLS